MACDSNTVLMLHGDTDFSDSSLSGHSPTLTNTPTIDTGVKVFGAGSMKFLRASSQYVTYPDSADWDFGTSDFTVDFRIRFISLPGGTHRFWEIGAYNNKGVAMWLDSNATMYVGIDNAFPTFAWSPSIDTWYHVALVRNGTDLKAFVNGTQIGTTQSNSANLTGGTNGVMLGAWNTSIDSFHDGYFEEFRISKGIARWTSNFTPPTEAYCPSAGGTGNMLLVF